MELNIQLLLVTVELLVLLQHLVEMVVILLLDLVLHFHSLALVVVEEWQIEILLILVDLVVVVDLMVTVDRQEQTDLQARCRLVELI
tara:strand:- start:227 stop:487 length:261 start_codon:yes stop_codon:yes gene_type:complete